MAVAAAAMATAAPEDPVAFKSIPGIEAGSGALEGDRTGVCGGGVFKIVRHVAAPLRGSGIAVYPKDDAQATTRLLAHNAGSGAVGSDGYIC
jgi:hypothetical protein